MYEKDDLLDGICSITCSIISLFSLIYTLIITDYRELLRYIPAFIFWSVFLILSIIFIIKIYLNKRKIQFDLEKLRQEKSNMKIL